MFGGAGAGFGKGNFAIRNNGFNNFFDSANAPGFLFTGDNTNVWQNVSVTYSDFLTSGANITGRTTSVVTSGTGVSNNPTAVFNVTGVSISEIASIRIQMRDANNGGVHFDNISVTAVPEPASFAALVGLAGLGLAASRRRRA